MKKFYFVILTLVLLPLLAYSQDVMVKNAIPTGFNSVQNDSWGNDVLISSFEPIGPMSGARGSNGTMYLAVNDTLATANLGLVIYQSTNAGNNWTLFPSGIGNRTNFARVKMLSVGDSNLCFFSIGGNIYRWNINSGFIAQFTPGPGTDFDVASTSTNSVYLYYITSTNALHRWGSVDYGITWANTGNVSSNVARPRLTKSGSGDTLVVNYRTITSPPENGQVNSFRYRETAPGVLALTGTSIIVAPAGTFRSEYKTVFRGSLMWFVYTEGQTGSVDLYYRLSTNNGAAFGTATQIGGSPGRDEYWFDALLGTGPAFTGIDLAYYSDSLQGGAANNSSDKIMYTGADASAPTVFGPPAQISEHPPVWSAAGYSPAMIEIPGISDVGVAWVGLDAGARKIYWDKYSLITSVIDPVNVPSVYELKQNFPNPFNPSTKISFTIPEKGFTTLKVYNVLGKEVADLVSKEMAGGSYEITFDASNISSGVYFYRLDVNGFSGVKKMVIQK